jgi:hypothetical protein
LRPWHRTSSSRRVRCACAVGVPWAALRTVVSARTPQVLIIFLAVVVFPKSPQHKQSVTSSQQALRLAPPAEMTPVMSA